MLLFAQQDRLKDTCFTYFRDATLGAFISILAPFPGGNRIRLRKGLKFVIFDGSMAEMGLAEWTLLKWSLAESVERTRRVPAEKTRASRSLRTAGPFLTLQAART